MRRNSHKTYLNFLLQVLVGLKFSNIDLDVSELLLKEKLGEVASKTT